MSILLLLSAALAADWPGPPADAPWTRLETGVEIQDLEAGTGEIVSVGAEAVVRYTGMLSDGTVFDSNMETTETLSFRVGAHQVIPGWEAGLVGMRVGGRRRLYIPSDQGYGARSLGPIPSNATLFFEVVLLEVEPPRAAPTAPAVVPDDTFRTLASGSARYADLTAGTGPRAKPGSRVCVDWATFREGALTESTWTRARCTWMRLGDDDLPAALDEGVLKMKVGGTRQVVEASGIVYEVHLEATGK